MSHCALGPQKCSQCAGAKPRRVDFVDGEVHIDGVPVRGVEPVSEPLRNYPKQDAGRGGPRKRR